jgi:hypothetical protein
MTCSRCERVMNHDRPQACPHCGTCERCADCGWCDTLQCCEISDPQYDEKLAAAPWNQPGYVDDAIYLPINRREA